MFEQQASQRLCKGEETYTAFICQKRTLIVIHRRKDAPNLKIFHQDTFIYLKCPSTCVLSIINPHACPFAEHDVASDDGYDEGDGLQPEQG